MNYQRVCAGQIPRALAGRYQEYSFTDKDLNWAYAYDGAEEWATLVSDAANTIIEHAEHSADTGLRAAEIEHAQKLCTYWRNRGFGSAVLAKPPIVSNPEQAARITPALRVIGMRMAAILRSTPGEQLADLYSHASVPVNRGKGSPFWLSGSDKMAAVQLHALWRGVTSLEGYFKRLQDAGPVRVRPCLTAYIRIQGSRKPVPRWTLTGTNLVLDGTRVGPKVRKVQANVFGLNSVLFGTTATLRYAMLSMDDRNANNLAQISRETRESKIAVALDYSAYDDSVAGETLDALRSSVLAPCYRVLYEKGVITKDRMRICLEIDEHMNRSPFLCPPREVGVAAELHDTYGGIKSGETPTALKGTLINRAIRDTQQRDAGWVAMVYNSGDDTLALSNDEVGYKRFQQLEPIPGITETVAPSPTFLMRHMPGAFGYVGRMVDGSINREPVNEPTSILQAAVGQLSRRTLLEGHPFGHVYDNIMRRRAPQLRAANVLSNARDLLLTFARSTTFNRLVGTREADDVREAFTRAADAGLLSREELAHLIRVLGYGESGLPLQRRSTVTVGELDGLVDELGHGQTAATVAIKTLTPKTDFR